MPKFDYPSSKMPQNNPQSRRRIAEYRAKERERRQRLLAEDDDWGGGDGDGGDDDKEEEEDGVDDWEVKADKNVDTVDWDNDAAQLDDDMHASHALSVQDDPTARTNFPAEDTLFPRKVRVPRRSSNSREAKTEGDGDDRDGERDGDWDIDFIALQSSPHSRKRPPSPHPTRSQSQHSDTLPPQSKRTRKSEVISLDDDDDDDDHHYHHRGDPDEVVW